MSAALPETPKSKESKSSCPTKSTDDSNKLSTPPKMKFDPAGDQLEWNADGREALMDHLIVQGLKGSDKSTLAEKACIVPVLHIYTMWR